jgi:DNA polymerase V
MEGPEGFQGYLQGDRLHSRVGVQYVHLMFSLAKIDKILTSVAETSLSLPIFLSPVQAGFPSPAEDFIDGALDLNDLIEHPAATFIVRVSGQSMTGAGIFDGDLLIVDRSITPRTGQIVVAIQQGDMVVKWLKRRQGTWWLLPDAPDHPEFHATPMVEGSEIWGVVKNVIRNLS